MPRNLLLQARGSQDAGIQSGTPCTSVLGLPLASAPIPDRKGLPSQGRVNWSASEICFSFPPLFLGIPACLLSHSTSLALSSTPFLSESLKADLELFAVCQKPSFLRDFPLGPRASCWQCAESRGVGTGSSSEWQLPGPQAWAYPTAHPPPDLLVLWSQVKGPLWPQEHDGHLAGTPWVSQEPHLSMSEPSTGLCSALCCFSEMPLPQFLLSSGFGCPLQPQPLELTLAIPPD